MKRLFTIIGTVTAVIIAASIIYFVLTRPPSGRVDAPKILAAAQTYARDLRAHGQAVPATIDLHDLIANGLLKPDDVSGFSGMKVSISLAVSEVNPQDVVMQVRMQDGSQIVALADGSVQSVLR